MSAAMVTGVVYWAQCSTAAAGGGRRDLRSTKPAGKSGKRVKTGLTLGRGCPPSAEASASAPS